MVAKTVEVMGIKNIGIGSDLCLNQPDSVVEWMRNGTWSKAKIMEKDLKQTRLP